MTEQFVPPGYVKIRDYSVTDDTSLRHRLASGELVAAVWNPRSGELVEIGRDHWLSDWRQTMIDKGSFRQISGYAQSESLPVLVKIDDGHNRRAIGDLNKHLNKSPGPHRRKKGKSGSRMQPEQKTLKAIDPASQPGKLRSIGGSGSDTWNTTIANQVVNCLWTKHSDEERKNSQL